MTDAMYGGNLALQLIKVDVLRSLDLDWSRMFSHQLSCFYSMTRLVRRNDCPPLGILGAMQETFTMLGGLKSGLMRLLWPCAGDDLYNALRYIVQDMDMSCKILRRIPTDELFPVRSMPLGSGAVPRPPVQGSCEGQRRAVPNSSTRREVMLKYQLKFLMTRNPSAVKVKGPEGQVELNCKCR